MKIQTFFLLAICLTGFFFRASAHEHNPTSKGFVVIELFTSEGCSSCPPADELVAKTQREYRDQPVYILAFHVDYWNRLGWKDVFSNAAFSKRQGDYAKSLHIPSVYTPQIVVNGKKEFVGSEEGNLHNAIIAGLKTPPLAQIIFNGIKNTGSQLSVNYRVSGSTKHAEVLLALVQKSAQTQVKAGENKGHTLSHVQIVRELQQATIEASNNGAGRLLIPKGINLQNLEVIALVQDTSNGEIIAAAKTPVPSPL